MKKTEKKRLDNVRVKVLNALRSAGEHGLTNIELSKIAVRYGGSLGELYKRGYDISKEYHGEGVYNYVLVSEPDTERVEDKSALDLLLEGVGEIGSVDKEELAWLLEELNLNVRRKAYTYKKKEVI